MHELRTSRLHAPVSWPLPGVCVVVLGGLAILTEWTPPGGVRGYARRAAPELELGQDKITKRNALFLRLGLLRLSDRFCEPDELRADSPAALALYGQPCPAPDPARMVAGMAPSTALMPPMEDPTAAQFTVVSLVCRGEDLFDPEHGLVTNPTATGKNWERAAWLSARHGSKMLVESPVGLKIHGGFSRKTPHQSFSLMFREKYSGRGQCDPGLFFGNDTPGASEIVLINATHPSKLKAALATEIAAALGCLTSRLLPAVVYLNGTQVLAPFFLYQHQSAEFVRSRFGLKDADWQRVKGSERRENPAFVRWRQWIRKDRVPTLLSEEAARFHIDDLNAWALTMSFTSTADNSQGGYFRERDKPDAVWRSLVWDMDCAFTHEVGVRGVGPYIDAQDPFPWLLGDRGRLFHRLVERTPEYRVAFRQFAHEALRTRLPQEKAMALADKYLDLARTHPGAGAEHIQIMETAKAFLSSRHESFLGYVDRHLQNAELAQNGSRTTAGAN